MRIVGWILLFIGWMAIWSQVEEGRVFSVTTLLVVGGAMLIELGNALIA